MRDLTRIRFWLVLFMIGLAVSGVTAFPLEAESGLLVRAIRRLARSQAAAAPSGVREEQLV